MKRVLIASLSLLVLALALSLTWLTTSESALHWIYRQIQPRLPGELQVREISGSLGGGFILRDIEFDDGSTRLAADRLLLDWNPWALLQARLQLTRIEAGTIDLRLTAAAAPDSRPADGDTVMPAIDIPLQVVLESLAIEQLSLQQGDGAYRLRRLQLQAEAEGSQVRVAQLDLNLYDIVIGEQKLGDIAVGLRGSIGIADAWPHDISIGWKTRLPNGAAIDNLTTLKGNIDATRLTHETAGPLKASLSLDLRQPLRDLRWQASLQLSEVDTALLDDALPALGGALDIDAEGDLQSARVSGRIDAETPEIGRFSSRFELESLEPDRLFDGMLVRSLDLAVLEGEIAANGKLYWTPALAWESTISARHVNPAVVLAEWPGDLSADLASDGQMEAGKLNAGVTIDSSSGSLRGYPLSLQGKARWRNETLHIESADLRSGDTRILANGSVGDTLNLDWSVESQNLGEIYPDARGQLKASGHLGGRVDIPTIEAKFSGRSIRLLEYAAAAVDGDIAIDLQNWQQLELYLAASDLELQGQRLQSVELDTDKSRIDARLVAERVKARFQFDGELRDQSWQGKLLDAEIDSVDFASWRLESPTALNLSAQQIKVEPLCLLSSGGAKICSSVQQSAADWDIDFELAAIPLGFLHPWTPEGLQLDGVVDATGQLTFTADGKLLGKLQTTLPPGSLSYPLQEGQLERFDYRIGRLDLALRPEGIASTVDLTLQNGDRLQARMDLPGASLLQLDTENQPLRASANVKMRNWSIVDGMIDQVENLRGVMQLELEAAGSLGQPRIKGRGQLREGGLFLSVLKANIDQIEFSASSEGSERIDYDASARIAQGTVSLRGNTVLHQQEGWPSEFSLRARGIRFGELLSSQLESGVTIDGELEADAELAFRASDRLRGKVDLRLPRGMLNYPLLEQEKESWEYREGYVSLVLDDRGINGASGLIVGASSSLEAELSLPGANPLALDAENQQLQGKMRVDFEELDLIEFLVPDIEQVQGKLVVDLEVDGRLQQPRLITRARIEQGSLRIPRLGLQIRRIRFDGNSDDLQDFNFTLTAHSGDGDLEITGSSRLDPAAGWPTRIAIKGSDFEVSRIPEAVVTVTPDLQVTLVKRSVNIEGNLLLPYAKLQPRDVSTAARVSNDTVIIGAEQAPEEKWLVTTRVRLTLGDRVTFFGFGFDSQLGGNLLVEDVPGQLSTGTGEITIKTGRYRAYGQRLDVSNGRLLFTGGALDNPGLDVRATREVDSIIVGLQVRGRLKQPQLELFSIPTMGQTDQLSYLLLGRPMEQADSSEGDRMAKAALALGLAGGDTLARQIGDRFGLDEMRVETGSTGDQASLVVGRYLSPDLYVSYGVGLVESINKFNVRYRLTERWRLEAESGEYQGADLLFTIER